MKSVEFVAWCHFGRLMGGGETYVEIELTDEEVIRLEEQDQEAETFGECEDVRDIYEKVYAVAVAQISEELRESDKEYGTTYLDGYESADDVYEVGVNWPAEL